MAPFIQSLHVYPIKSCQGIEFQRVELVDTGFQYDRHWMLVDQQGLFLSQRQLPSMSRIKTALTAHSLVISADGYSSLEIPLESKNTQRKKVKIWNDQCRAAIVPGDSSRWFSEFLGTECDLVYLPETEKRQVDQNFADPADSVGFADGFPLLLLTQSSIELLSDRVGEKLDINRFRANIVVGGCQAHAEDQWLKIEVNGIDIHLVKPCSRCVIPSIDQQTASKHASLLKILASYRRKNGKIYFGQNCLHQGRGILSVGQSLAIR